MTRIERIRELRSRIGELSAEELTELNDLCFQEYDELAAAEPSDKTVASLQEIGTILNDVDAEQEQRTTAAAALAEQMDAAKAAIESRRNPAEPEAPTLADTVEDPEVEDPEVEEVEDPEANPANPEGAETLPIAAGAVSAPASVPRAGAMNQARRTPVRPAPEQRSDTRRHPTVVAGAGLRDLNPGDPITDSMTLANAMVDMLRGLDRTAPSTGRHVVARARWEDTYPEERRLGADAQLNTERIAAVCSPQAIVASGGVCLPVNVDYSVPTWAGATRPLRDALPGFQADRGGLRFVSPPDIGVPSLQATPPSGLGAATSIWTEATDANPAGATKPVYVVQCGSEQLVYVNAIPTRLQFGNMQGRFAPEQLAANTEVAVAVAARDAELELLTLMYGSTKQIETQQYLGATRDLLAAADILVHKYRYSHRIPETAPLTAVFPSWAKGVIRADMAREIGHDNAGSQNVLAITDDQIEDWFSVRSVNIIWTLDGVKAGTYGTGGQAITNQFFGLAATSAAAVQWPGQTATGAFQVVWLLYAEGSFQFLDGGRLTLGVVRDSTLDGTNDYETFVETFEGIAFRGIEAYQVQSTIAPTGGSAGTIASAVGTKYKE